MASTVGIDDISLYVPRLYLPIEALAKARDLEYDKLNKGLGLTHMAVPDTYEDAATMTANAVRTLLERNELDPRTIGRIYLGTESALDDAKPTASYALEMLAQYFEPQYGPYCFLHCDVVDLNFACIGGVDALQNTIDWVRGGRGRTGIVVTADIAKYELGSTGEYTQGAGAVALLVREKPRLMVIPDSWGVATVGVHDFYKPKRNATKHEIVEEVLRLADFQGCSVHQVLEKIEDSISVHGILDCNEQHITIHKETPVFDGPYSNQCYQDRIRQAFLDFEHKAGLAGHGPNGVPLTERWSRLVFHLPYAFQARRMFSELYVLEARRTGRWAAFLEQTGLQEPSPESFTDTAACEVAQAEFLRQVTKTKEYQAFVGEKIEKGERASGLVGNMYTGSIFLALMSTLEADRQEDQDLAGASIGFFAYGSGSKSKVFEGVLQPQWKEVVSRFGLTEQLNRRTAIDYSTYEKLHRGLLTEPVVSPAGEFALHHISEEKPLVGVRTYRWEGERVTAAWLK